MLVIYSAKPCFREQQWIFKVVFEHFLGLDYRVVQGEGETIEVGLDGSEKKITFPVCFFSWVDTAWLAQIKPLKTLSFTFLSLSERCLVEANAQETLPVLWKQRDMQVSKDKIDFGWDLWGACFFFLSCYEEKITPIRDLHKRFSFSASIFSQLRDQRPLVDEYVAFLWSALRRLWPQLVCKERTFSKNITCDVDLVYENRHLPSLARSIGGDLLKRRNIKEAVRKSLNYVASSLNYYHFDRVDTFDWMMTLNESMGNQITFYFIAGQHSPFEGFYQIEEPRVRKLIQNIVRRGHQIGLHFSYHTYNNPDYMLQEKTRFIRVLRDMNIDLELVHSRQHYLRWEHSRTAQYLSEVGICYDSSLGFADHPGFRCGTSHRFPMYSLEKREALELWQIPLILMECSVLANRFLGMDYTEETFAYLDSFKRICQTYQGEFTLLWHNSHFMSAEDKNYYKRLIS